MAGETSVLDRSSRVLEDDYRTARLTEGDRRRLIMAPSGHTAVAATVSAPIEITPQPTEVDPHAWVEPSGDAAIARDIAVRAFRSIPSASPDILAAASTLMPSDVHLP